MAVLEKEEKTIQVEKNILISNVPKHPQFNEEINLQIKKAHEPHVE